MTLGGTERGSLGPLTNLELLLPVLNLKKGWLLFLLETWSSLIEVTSDFHGSFIATGRWVAGEWKGEYLPADLPSLLDTPSHCGR